MGIDRAGPAYLSSRQQGTRKAQSYAPDSKSGARVTVSMADALAQYREDVQQKALRSAAYAGARMLYDEMVIRAGGYAGQYSGPLKHSDPEKNKTHGLLQASIYHYYDLDKSTATRHVYAIGPNKREAPHWFNVEYGHYRVNEVIVNTQGQLVTKKFGAPISKWVPARPYIRPTWDAKGASAVQAMLAKLRDNLLGLETVGF